MEELISSEVGYIQELVGRTIEFLVQYGFQMFGALVVMAIGFWMSGLVRRGVSGWEALMWRCKNIPSFARAREGYKPAHWCV